MKRFLVVAVLSLVLATVAEAASPWPAACIQPIVAGQTVSGTLTAADCSYYLSGDPSKLYYADIYSFSGTAGQQIAIAMNSSAVDAWLDLYSVNDVTASALVYDDDGGGGTNARIPAGTGYYTLPATGTYYVWANTAVANQTGAYTISLNVAGAAPPAGETIVYEFYHPGFDHYFITAYQAEADSLKAGNLPPWVATGKTFKVWTGAGTSIGNVWRFFSASFAPKSGHFYTNSATEAQALQAGRTWTLEATNAFYMMASPSGTCPSQTIPLYRLYNNGQGGSPNHRYTTDPSVRMAMIDANWVPEGNGADGVFACVLAGVTGGTFKTPNGAGVTVVSGAIPPSVSAVQPATTPASQVPAGLSIDTADGEINVTLGAPAYDFTLTGSGGFSTTTAGAVTISLPFNAAAIPVADVSNSTRVLMRIYDPATGSQADLTGDIAVTGSNGMLTVETRGLPPGFTAAVVYSPNMVAVPAEATAAYGEAPGATAIAPKAATTWPAQSWCIIYRSTDPDLVAAVKNIYGIAGAPTAAQIRAAILDKVAGSARKAQAIYQADGFAGPNLYIGRTACRDNIARYNIHMVNAKSRFNPDDPNEQASTDNTHYGRLYIQYNYMNKKLAGDGFTILNVVAHEIQHGIQNGYGMLGESGKGYREGSATTYGMTFDYNQAIAVRGETEMLDHSLMSPTLEDRYNNEDFFAYVGKQYHGGKLNYLVGLWSQMQGAVGGVDGPPAATMYGVMDTYFRAAFAQPLQAIYLDFVRQRALDHNANSQFGRRPNDVTTGFAANLFTVDGTYTRAVNLATCTSNKFTLTWSDREPYSTAAILLNAAGVLPAGVNGQNLVVKIMPSASSVGALWNGFTHRAGTSATLAATNSFAGFGKTANEQVVVLVSNLDPANNGTFKAEVSCGGVSITSLNPVKGPVGTSVTITGIGFGTAADTRSVTFNGVAATGVTWTGDTQAIAKVPANASSGEVVVTVNGEKSNGVNFEVVAQCSATQNAGGDVPDTRTIELGKTAGTFAFAYETYSQEDQIIVRYMGGTLFDTGCVGANGTRSLSYAGTSSQITVQVIPNCKGGSGTSWNYTVSCP
jgi:hypothetical protein